VRLTSCPIVTTLLGVGRRSLCAASAVVATAALAACAGESTTAAGPTKICGHVLYSGAMGMFTYDVWSANKNLPPMPTRLSPVPAGKSLPSVLLRVAPGCASGATLTVSPSDGLVVVNRVLGNDGRPVAVALQGGAPGPVTLSGTVGQKSRELRFVVGASS